MTVSDLLVKALDLILKETSISAWGAIYQYDEQHGELRLQVFESRSPSSAYESPLEPPQRVQVVEGCPAQERLEPLTFEAPCPLPCPVGSFSGEGLSMTCSPIGAEDRLYGTLVLAAKGKPEQLSEAQTLLSAAGRVLGLALHSCWQTRLSETTQQILGLLAEDKPLDQSYQGFFRLLARVIPFERAAIAFPGGRLGSDGVSDEITFLSVNRETNPWTAVQETAPFEGSRAGHAVKIQEVLLNPDIRGNPEFLEDRFLAEAGLATNLVVPLVFEGRSIGALNFGHRTTGAYARAAVNYLRSFAAPLALALQRHEERQKAAERARRIEVGREIDRSILSARKVEDVLVQINLGYRELLSCEGVTAILASGDGRFALPRVSLEKLDFSFNEGFVLRPEDCLPLEAVRTGRFHYWPRYQEDPDLRAWDKRAIADADVRSVMSVPLHARGEIFGALIIGSKAADAFSEREITLAQELADEAAVAIDNARLYERSRKMVQTLQLHLLPEDPPSIQGWQFGCHYASATEGALVGGDFYDFLELLSGRLIIAIGDVCGKGIEAAADTAMVKYSLRCSVLHADSLCAAVGELTSSVARSLRRGHFVTMAMCELDPDTGSISHCCAGHPPPAILRADGEVVRLAHNSSPALGLPVAAPCPCGPVQVLNKGDTLVLFTDGLSEARSGAGRLYGRAGIERALVGAQDHDVHALIEKLAGGAMAFAEGKLRDDIAIVAVKRL